MADSVGFGEFELDASRFELRRGGRRVSVQPKVLRLLFYLVERRGRSVPSAELLAALWPRERVTAASLKRAVAGARRALGESAQSQHSIRTVRGHGYQFMPPALPDPPPSASSPLSTSGALFVGRARELRLLEEALARARGGQEQALLIAGEPGVGKTRVLHELAGRAAAGGAQVWLARCAGAVGAPSHWPLLQIVREAARDLSPSGLASAMGSGASDIVEALPELAAYLPAVAQPPRIDCASTRFRLFDSLAVFLRRAAEQRPLVLLFDDLDQADRVTLQLLAFLTHQLDRSRVLWAATQQSGPQRDALRAGPLEAIARQPCVRSLELAGLDSGEVARWIALRTGKEAPAALVEQLHAQTGGNPLFLEQVVSDATAPASARVDWRRFSDGSPRHGVRHAIERHLERMSAESREVLRAASVLGRDFSLALLAELQETRLEPLQAQLAAALETGLVRAHPDGFGQYAFAHALIRDALYQQLPAAERARLHGQAARALEARYRGSEATLGQLAEHYLRAAPDHDAGQALRVSVLAARAALQRSAWEEAAHHFARARGVLQLYPPDPERDMELSLEQGDALVCAGAAQPAIELLRAAAALARELGHPEITVRAALAMARLPETGTPDPLRVVLIERALALLPERDARHACLSALHAKALIFSRDRAACTRLARKALAAARKLEQPELRVQALLGCLHGLAEPSCLEERLEIGSALAQLGHEQGDHRSLLWASTARVWSSVELGDFRAVDSAIEALETLAERVREPFFRWHAKSYRAMRALIAGQPEEAKRLTREAYERGQPLGDSAWRVYCVQMSSILRLQGEREATESLVREVSLRHPAIAGWQAVLATLEAERGAIAQGREVLARLMARDLEALRADPYGPGVLAAAADLCGVVGDACQAKLLYAALRPYAQRHGCISQGFGTHGPLARHLGHLALQMREPSAAERHFQEALAAAEAMPSPTYESIALLSYASFLLSSAGPRARPRAFTMLARARRIAQAHALHAIPTYCAALALRHSRSPAREARSA